jgi:hypothetical protein
MLIFNLSFRKWFKPEMLAKHGAFMLVGEPGKSILEVSI